MKYAMDRYNINPIHQGFTFLAIFTESQPDEVTKYTHILHGTKVGLYNALQSTKQVE